MIWTKHNENYMSKFQKTSLKTPNINFHTLQNKCLHFCTFYFCIFYILILFTNLHFKYIYIYFCWGPQSFTRLNCFQTLLFREYILRQARRAVTATARTVTGRQQLRLQIFRSLVGTARNWARLECEGCPTYQAYMPCIRNAYVPSRCKRKLLSIREFRRPYFVKTWGFGLTRLKVAS